MLLLQGITYSHPNKDPLFSNLDLTINKYDKTALVGNNGSGKSTLLKLIAGELNPVSGSIKTASRVFYIPQQLAQYNHCSIAQALGVESKLKALAAILSGDANEANLDILNDEWDIEQRCREALTIWHLHDLDLATSMSNLSGGQKTRVFLAGINIHKPDLVLLDEPSNNLDASGRKLLYEYILSTRNTLVIVSHDRMLLNLVNRIMELRNGTPYPYGGNYDFYAAQKTVEAEALEEQVKEKEKTLRKAKETERTAMTRQQKLDARGKKKQTAAGLPKIMMNTLKNNAEKSTAKMKDVHKEKVESVVKDLLSLRKELPDIDKMKPGFDTSTQHKGKTLINATSINFAYTKDFLWSQHVSFQLVSGERLAIKAPNGFGKSTLLKIILGNLEPQNGTIKRADIRSVYLDQEYSLIDTAVSVYEQASKYNTAGLEEYEIKTRLSRFLFNAHQWAVNCTNLSGGEKMRLSLCCMDLTHKAPDLIVLDEPTNNLDLQNINILTSAIANYKGTVLVVSHDEVFLEEIGIERVIHLR